MSTYRQARVVDLAVRKARDNRVLRQRYALGWIGWITLGIQLVQLIAELIRLYQEKERIEAFTDGSGRAYEVMRADDGFDLDLIGVLESADRETPGS